ncbi:DUF4231 domain-containing protein [Pseudoleptotrichia goodfellowii]|uniref:DUF4231 domain-containing protein n=1 Tax=Pseudoleptotrichia goodfellowii F0264 TaxID=596323 RepID=D0GMY8_9FUSO|nr:DUF4231 domain-containing protein [Pseudoleptotrichia goodfellowii]EEY34536.1 hypothetical protein HMPREF0554_0263 [Pseudoleptotrichia goodfellowii F0264]
MNSETYLKERVEDQINWYDKKSSENKKRYYKFKLFEIIAGMLVSILSIFLKGGYLKYIISILSFLITGINSISFFLKCQENWIKYRETSEILKQEKYMFLASGGVYNIEDENKFKLFVERCETVISSENINWAQINNKEKKK